MKSLKERLEEKIESDSDRYRFKYLNITGKNTLDINAIPILDYWKHHKAGAASLVPLVVELAEKLEFYADGEGDVLDWDRVNDKACMQDRGKTARKALQSIEKFLEGK